MDEGSWRRMLLFRFPFRFRTNPEAPEDRPGDAGLKTRVREGNEGQHDAIITWLAEGAKRYYADRTIIMDDKRPAGVVQATLDWRKQADRILAYVEERLSFDDPDGMVARADLYHDFVRFLDEQGHSKWSQETFLSRFRTHELIRSRMIAEGQTRNKDGLSRPMIPGATFSSSLPTLPSVPRIFRGITFKPF